MGSDIGTDFETSFTNGDAESNPASDAPPIELSDSAPCSDSSLTPGNLSTAQPPASQAAQISTPARSKTTTPTDCTENADNTSPPPPDNTASKKRLSAQSTQDSICLSSQISIEPHGHAPSSIHKRLRPATPNRHDTTAVDASLSEILTTDTPVQLSGHLSRTELGSSQIGSSHVEHVPSAGTVPGDPSGCHSFESGFTTGSNKKLFIDPAKAPALREFADLLADSGPATPAREHARPAARPEEAAVAAPPVHNAVPRVRADIDSAFRHLRTVFPGEEPAWLVAQLRWAWLHHILNPPMTHERLAAQIALRRRVEDSVLARIAEFDEAPARHMVLGVLRLLPDSVVIFDGFHCATARIDAPLRRYLQASGCGLGTRLRIFGAERLIAEPTAILSLNEPLLRLFLNSTVVERDAVHFGRCRPLAFQRRLAEVESQGGIVSAVVVRVVRILERRFSVQLAGYRSCVEDLERELEHIQEMVERAGAAYTRADLRVTPMTKLLVTDASAECILTWWQAPEIAVGDTYKLVYLRPVPDARLHLSVDRRSYTELIPARRGVD